MRRIIIFICIFFAFCIAVPFLATAQIVKELPCKTTEEADARLAKAKAETERLRAELARLQALIPAEPETFLIPWDCSKYPNTSARQMCESAHAELAKNSGNGSHEASHAINSMCRETPEFRNKRSGTCIHVGWAKNKDGDVVPRMIWVDEPKSTTIKGLGTSGCIPGFLSACKPYQKYVVQSQVLPPGAPSNAAIWTNLTYLFDEWGAYNIGARKNIADELKRGNRTIDRTALDMIVREPVVFSIMSASILQYVQKNDPARFADKDFRLFIKSQIENSVAIIREALLVRDSKGLFRNPKGVADSTASAQALVEQFTRTPQAQLLRDMYGDAWFNRTFNIDF